MNSTSPRRSRNVAVLAVAGQEPQADRDLGRVEQLARQGDHAVDQVGLDEVLADLALARLVATTSSRWPARSRRCPSGARWWTMCCTQAKLALPFGGAPYFQRLSSLQALAAPVADVEGRIGEDEVGLQVGVAVVVEGVAVGDLAVDAADGEVHLRQPPGGVVGLLPVDGDVGRRCRRCRCRSWAPMNSSDCTNMPDEPQQGS